MGIKLHPDNTNRDDSSVNLAWKPLIRDLKEWRQSLTKELKPYRGPWKGLTSSVPSQRPPSSDTCLGSPHWPGSIYTSFHSGYFNNSQINEDLWILFLTSNITTLTASLNSKLADAGSPLVRHFERHLCWPRADWSPTPVTMVNCCSVGQPRLSLKRQPSRRNE
jgi:hypothetical protein